MPPLAASASLVVGEPISSRVRHSDTRCAGDSTWLQNTRKALRKRTTRACDKCRTAKTKCDGGLPCRHCIDYDVLCTYSRERKRPGRPPNPKTRSQAPCPRRPSASRVRGWSDGIGQANRRRCRQDPSSPMEADAQIVPSQPSQSSVERNLRMMALEEPFYASSRVEHTPLDLMSSYGQLSQLTSPFSVLRNGYDAQIHPPKPLPVCRYPVLYPVLPYLGGVIPVKVACDLLDLYFTEPSTSLFECASPYVLAQIFRKKSFLCDNEPRECKSSMLAAMLWVAAQTCSTPEFTSSTHARSSICSQLYDLSVGLLGQHNEQPICNPEMAQSSSAAVGYGSDTNDKCSCVSGSRLPTGRNLDDVLTYVLLGTVISGSESRRNCLQWWTKAWALGKDLRLNQELECRCYSTHLLPLTGATYHQQPYVASRQFPALKFEEMKEERRRTWWLLYIADRHLALSYNAPLNILDAECQVYQPLDEATWENLNSSEYDRLSRFFGPPTKMLGFTLFEYFLPLMAILGDIVDVHHQFWSPRFGKGGLDDAVARIEKCLDVYDGSLRELEDSLIMLPSIVQPSDISSPQIPFSGQDAWAAKLSRQKAVIAYSKHLLHVLHILLHGSWDPISMLDNPAHWITPQSFVKCAKHAVSAASAVSDILKQDPELSFKPYLFGIYLMHGSFVLLVFADQKEMMTSETIIQACETIIRAHEVCVVTLNTEYQRNFRKVVRSALSTLTCSMPVDIVQHKIKRRELLSLYRWTNCGKGLAV